ncbi:MAG: hypothetical protein ACPIOQ_66605, partial [Promethearchaeia archaeon]
MDEDIDVSGNDFGTHRRRYAVASFLSVSSYTRFTFTMLVLSIVAPPVSLATVRRYLSFSWLVKSSQTTWQ